MFLPQAALMDNEITIRRAESLADYRACQDAQRKAWGITEEGYVIPVATMVGANLHGGLVLGAFLADGTAVAMSFGFLGRLEERICLYSQLTGVVPELPVARPWLRGQDRSALYGPRRGPGPDRLGLRSAPGRKRPLQSQPPGRPGPPLHRQHVRRADRCASTRVFRPIA